MFCICYVVSLKNNSLIPPYSKIKLIDYHNLLCVLFSRGLSRDKFISPEATIFKNLVKMAFHLVQLNIVKAKTKSFSPFKLSLKTFAARLFTYNVFFCYLILNVFSLFPADISAILDAAVLFRSRHNNRTSYQRTLTLT